MSRGLVTALGWLRLLAARRWFSEPSPLPQHQLTAGGEVRVCCGSVMVAGGGGGRGEWSGTSARGTHTHAWRLRGSFSRRTEHAVDRTRRRLVCLRFCSLLGVPDGERAKRWAGSGGTYPAFPRFGIVSLGRWLVPVGCFRLNSAKSARAYSPSQLHFLSPTLLVENNERSSSAR